MSGHASVGDGGDYWPLAGHEGHPLVAGCTISSGLHVREQPLQNLLLGVDLIHWGVGVARGGGQGGMGGGRTDGEPRGNNRCEPAQLRTPAGGVQSSPGNVGQSKV